VTNTARVQAPPAANTTKRVFTTGEVVASGGSLGNDRWGGTWGGTWGNTWRGVNLGTGAASASPSENSTKRVSGAATANNTKRVAA
jgi:hypothetical protein